MDNKHLFLFHQCAEDLDLVVDLRRMINKKKVTYDPLSTIVHPDSGWSKGHMVHVFYQKKGIMSFVVPILNLDQVDHVKRALEPVPLAQCTDVDYEAMPPPSSTHTKPPAAPGGSKAKKAKPSE